MEAAKRYQNRGAHHVFSHYCVSMSPHTDRDCVTRPAKVCQPDWNGNAGPNSAGYPNVHLVVAGIAGSSAEIQNIRETAADRHLRGNHSVRKQTGGVHRQDFSSKRRVGRRCNLSRDRVPDCALLLTVLRERVQHRRGYRHRGLVEFRGVERDLKARLPVALSPSRDQNSAVLQEGSNVVDAHHSHIASGTEGSTVRVIEFGASVVIVEGGALDRKSTRLN